MTTSEKWGTGLGLIAIAISVWAAYEAHEARIGSDAPILQMEDPKFIDHNNMKFIIRNVGKTPAVNIKNHYRQKIGKWGFEESIYPVFSTTFEIPGEITVFYTPSGALKSVDGYASLVGRGLYPNIAEENAHWRQLAGSIDYTDLANHAFSYPWCFQIHVPDDKSKPSLTPCIDAGK